MQMYKVFYSDVQITPGTEPPTMAKLIPLEFVTREEAMDEAFKRIYHGGIVWKIEGPEGFHLGREEIDKQYRIFRST